MTIPRVGKYGTVRTLKKKVVKTEITIKATPPPLISDAQHKMMCNI